MIFMGKRLACHRAEQPQRSMLLRLLTLLVLPALLALSGCANLPQTASNAPVASSAFDDGSSSDNVDYSILPAINTPAQSAREAVWMNDGNLWHYIAARFTLPIPNNPRIQQQLAFYSSHIDYLERVTERAKPYLHMIVADLQENKLPLELALLPIVESAYLPGAVSSSNAAGIWQFVRSTGEHFGLRRTVWYDGRRDIKASTDAAMLYFTRLRIMFNDDWPIVIASYNGGEGTLQNAIAYNQSKGLPTDFWDLTRISKQTADYPARLYALVIIFSNPEKYGFHPYPIPNQSVVTEIALNKSVNLNKLASLTGMTHDELFNLNPGFDKSITGPETTNLLVPKSLASQFTPTALEEAEKSAMNWGRYTLRRGDNFHKLAYRYGCDVDELLKVNRLSSAYARPGETIIVPLGRGKTLLASGEDQLYTVQGGDSLWGLAHRFDMELTDLKRINGLKSVDSIHPGQKLIVAAHHERLRADQKQSKRIAESSGQYIVQKGDTLWNVALRFSTTVEQLIASNRLDSTTPLQPGQVLMVARK